ncbi:MAG: hypothetical protein A2015_13925 [Spirochaetes bacterium GWF1_31_7]|nr:MAG: hypothetical protein A2Y30_03825 [Spirochaetes bacterium GWE1_32_154]OHD48144.1 MAG: hypothetical protein A2Y29_10930 [Spirochaetes bacterium GWE2_31_10]OHD50501.1 MAG: hypothetical protein A2015_13925 [Spirochaetes bacterium GWF1_31_7]HBD94694.1 hypothetical protein [Spirochaetia bacterium]HBI36624.1 hypothetical protein [Spirochaetia bacterium]
MKQYYIVLICILFIVSCTENPNIESSNLNKTIKVTIRSGNTTTEHKVNSDNLIVSNSYKNIYDNVNTRIYSYNEFKELQSVTKNMSSNNSETMFISREKNRSANNQLTKTVKTITNSRGSNQTYTIEYFYDENGKVIGMVQKDSNGNIVAKGVNN